MTKSTAYSRASRVQSRYQVHNQSSPRRHPHCHDDFTIDPMSHCLPFQKSCGPMGSVWPTQKLLYLITVTLKKRRDPHPLTLWNICEYQDHQFQFRKENLSNTNLLVFCNNFKCTVSVLKSWNVNWAPPHPQEVFLHTSSFPGCVQEAKQRHIPLSASHKTKNTLHH